MFHRFVIQLRRNNSYLLSQMGNMDETPLYFGMPTNMTIEEQGEKYAIICANGCEKQLLLYVIFKRKIVTKTKLVKGVHMHVEGNGSTGSA